MLITICPSSTPNSRRAQGETPQPDPAPRPRRPDQRRDDRRDGRQRQHLHLRRPHRQQRRQRTGMAGQRRQPHHRGRDPIADRCKGGNRCNIIAIEAQPRIDPPPHRAARNRRQPDGIAKGIGHQPAGDHHRAGQGLANMAQRRPVIARKAQIRPQRAQHRQPHHVPRRLRDLGADLRQVDFRQQPVQRHQPHQEQPPRRQIRQRRPQTGQSAGAGKGGIGHGVAFGADGLAGILAAPRGRAMAHDVRAGRVNVDFL